MRQPVPFGKYLLLDRISVGGMAEVFRAKSYGVEGFEKIIAIKRILPAMGEDKDFIKMFIDEAKIAGQLSHANICQIFELGKILGSHFIAMEYIWGKDLLQIQNRLRKLGDVMPVGMACYVTSKVCEGLDYAHRKKDAMGRPLEIIHRDCSPQNVLVSYEGEVKIIDFGIARAASRSSRTNAGVLKGKFGYMSPEQVRGLPLDHRSDLFAIGTCFYESLTGERLFQGESDFSTLERVRNADVRPPSQLNQNIPPEVEGIVMRALTRDPKARFESGAEMHAALQAFLTRQSVPFTSKTLADWVKAAFRDDLEREKQQMEDYKRIGRDGLIAGVPQARARMDIVAELGQPPPIEGDPTALGGPSFEDMSQDELDAWLNTSLPSGAQPPGPNVAAGRRAAPQGARGKVVRAGSEGDWEPEEAPTEVFGEIGVPTPPGLEALGRRGGTAAPPSVLASPAPVPARSGRGTLGPSSHAPSTAPAHAPPGRAAGAPGQGPPGMAPQGAMIHPSPSVRGPSGAPPQPGQPYQGAPQPQHGQPYPGPPQPQHGQPYQGPPQPQHGQPYPGPPPQHGQPYPGPPPQHGQPYPGTPQPQHGRPHQGPPSGQPYQGQPPPPPQQGQPYQGPHGQGPTMLGPPGLHDHGNSDQRPRNQGSHVGPQPHPASVPLAGGAYPHPADPAAANRQTMLAGRPPAMPPAPEGGSLPAFYPVLQPGRPLYPEVAGGNHGPYPPPASERPRGPSVAPRPSGGLWRRASSTRDIAIGCAIAALVVAGIVSAKFLLFGDEPEAEAQIAATGTILVSVRDSQPAEVAVDGKIAGAIRDKSPLTLSALPPGGHTVQVTRAGAPDCDREVKLASRQVLVVECDFPKQPTYGRLILEGIEPTHRVFVDDQEISVEAAREPLHLTPGVEHAIQVKAGTGAAATVDEFTIELEPGTELRRALKTGKSPTRDKDRGESGSRSTRGASARESRAAPPEPSSEEVQLEDDDDLDEPEPPTRSRGGARAGAAAASSAVTSTQPGSFTAFTQPFARVFIDGKDTGKMTPIAPRSAIALPPGSHDITFVVGEKRFNYRITIAPGEHKNLIRTLPVQ